MNKRLLSLLLVMAMLVTSVAVLASCDNETPDTPTGVPTEERPTETPTEGDVQEPTETPTDNTTEAPTSEPTSSPTEEPTETPTEVPLDDIVYENGDTVKDAGVQWDEEVFALTENNIDESKAVDISAAELIALLKDKESEVLKQGDVYRVSEPIVLESNTKYYGNLAGIIAAGGIVIKNVEEIVVKELVVKGEIKIESSTGITFFQLDIKGGETGLVIDSASSDIALKNCKVYGSDTALRSEGDLVSIYCGYFAAANGIISNGEDLAVQNSQIVALKNGITSSGLGTIIKNNLIEIASDGTGIELIEGSENALVALNVVKDAQISVKVSNGFNCVVLLNSAIRIVGENNVNLYVVENSLGGAIELKNNEYLLCEGNSFINDGKQHPVVNEGNTEYNGNNLHDVNARPDYGANEDLLPHTNKDLFISMERHGKVRDISMTKSYSYSNYMRTMGRKNSVVIVPPGVYTISEHLTLDATQSNTTFYAYGVYQEKDSLGMALYISSGSNIEINGLTVGYQFQSSGQAYVLEVLDKREQTFRVVSNAGYVNDFGKSDLKIFSGSTDMFKEDSLSPWKSGMGYSLVEKCDDGTMILKYTGSAKEFSLIEPGDVLACRLAGDNNRSIWVVGANNKLKDFVLYGYAAALAIVSSGRGTVNCSAERFHNTVHSGPVIDEETYNRYVELENTYGADLEVYIDEEGRYRGGLPRVGSVDATHILTAERGFSATSCLFESMCDDGSNQRASSSRLAGYKVNDDGETMTLYFKGTLSETYFGIHKSDHYATATPSMAPIPQAGDKLFVYASNGHIAFEGTALTNAQKVDEYPGYHVAHMDENGDCICDDTSCNAHMHYDMGPISAPNRDGKCDLCGTDVYIDINRDKICDIRRVAFTDNDGDGVSDTDGIPVIYDVTQKEIFTPESGMLTYQAYYSDGSGKHIIQYTTYVYEVQVSKDLVDTAAFEGYDLTDNDYHMDDKILFDNLSMNSAGFTFDNVLIQYTRSRGILVKTVDATIKNCTFRDHGMTAILLSVETSWGESSVPQNVLIQNCLFDNTGSLLGYDSNMTHAPISLQGLGSFSGNVAPSENTLPCKNIRIIGNKFINTANNYCITMAAAQDITIADNVFTAREGDTERRYGRAIYITGCMDINISGNHYESEFFKDDISKAIIGWNYKNLGGSDIVTKNENGENIYLLPQEKGPKS